MSVGQLDPRRRELVDLGAAMGVEKLVGTLEEAREGLAIAAVAREPYASGGPDVLGDAAQGSTGAAQRELG